WVLRSSLLLRYDTRHRLTYLLNLGIVQLTAAEREVGDDLLLDKEQHGDVGVAGEAIAWGAIGGLEHAQGHTAQGVLLAPLHQLGIEAELILVQKSDPGAQMIRLVLGDSLVQPVHQL